VLDELVLYAVVAWGDLVDSLVLVLGRVPVVLNVYGQYPCIDCRRL